MSTAFYIYNFLYPSVTPTGVPILWIVLGVSVALSALVVGIIVYRKRAKRNARYFFMNALYFDNYMHAEISVCLSQSSRAGQCDQGDVTFVTLCKPGSHL